MFFFLKKKKQSGPISHINHNVHPLWIGFLKRFLVPNKLKLREKKGKAVLQVDRQPNISFSCNVIQEVASVATYNWWVE
jgi:hypothetical protein